LAICHKRAEIFLHWSSPAKQYPKLMAALFLMAFGHEVLFDAVFMSPATTTPIKGLDIQPNFPVSNIPV
jgi:hypothetical protein